MAAATGGNINVPAKMHDAEVVQAQEVRTHDMRAHEIEEPEVQEAEVIHEPKTVGSMEEEMIRQALERHDGNRKEAAAELGISERTLYRRISKGG